MNDYVSNRNYKLQGIIDTFKVSRKVAKELILVMMYGGCVNQYCCDNGFDITIPMPLWVGELEKEMTLLTDRICSNEATIFKEVSKLKKQKNKKASCLSYVLQIIEDDLIMNASNKLKQLNYVVDTLCFDGLLVNATNLSSELLEELSSYCYECSGNKVEFSFKPMEKHYECVEQEFDVSEYEYKHLDEYDQRYCGTLEGECDEETYQIRKGYLELFL